MSRTTDGPDRLLARRVHSVFEQQAARAPAAPALFEDERVLTYQDVNERSNRLARYLARRGAGPGRHVAICCRRSPDLVIAVIAILKTGASFVPLDTSLPPARALAILNDAQPAMLLAESRDDELPSAFRGEVVVLAERAAEIDAEHASNPAFDQPIAPVLAVLYTSGVTGKPKGVVVPDAAVLYHMRWMWERFPFRTSDVGVLHRSLMLISSSWDYFGPLLAGVPSVLVTEREAKDPPAMFARLARKRVSHISGSPPFWDAILDEVARKPAEWSSVRLATISGEQVSVRIVRRWRRAFPDACLLNVYGSTECVRPVVYDTSTLPSDAERVPIGTPLPGVWAGILDEDLRPVPHGEVGELCVSGPCVASGYLNLPDLTGERFVRTADAAPDGGVMYRTGDVGRLRSDGDLELVGRRDQQVKVRGYRVELGDVRATLLQHDGVRQAAVVARDDPHGGKRLVAYVVSDVEPPPSSAELRRFLTDALPDYMVPSFFVPLESLPLTRSGKTDLAALPDPIAAAAADGGEQAPVTATERALAAIWAEVFERATIVPDDDFFELGGHSLLAMQIASRVVERMGVELPMDVLFSTPTLRAVATGLDAALAKAAARRAPAPEPAHGASTAVV